MSTKYRILFCLSRRWCRLPKCWKYTHNGVEVVHYIWWDGRKYDVWQFLLPLE